VCGLATRVALSGYATFVMIGFVKLTWYWIASEFIRAGVLTWNRFNFSIFHEKTANFGDYRRQFVQLSHTFVNLTVNSENSIDTFH